jgi:hypothetical protein
VWIRAVLAWGRPEHGGKPTGNRYSSTTTHAAIEHV